MCRGRRGSLQCYRVTDSKCISICFPHTVNKKNTFPVVTTSPWPPSYSLPSPIGDRPLDLTHSTNVPNLTVFETTFEVRLSNFITLITFRFNVRWNGHFGQIRVRPTAAHCIYNACTLYLRAHACIRWNAYATLNLIGFSIHNHTPVSNSKFTT